MKKPETEAEDRLFESAPYLVRDLMRKARAERRQRQRQAFREAVAAQSASEALKPPTSEL